jgi:hypothetical protein
LDNVFDDGTENVDRGLVGPAILHVEFVDVLLVSLLMVYMFVRGALF